ncbi:MAG: hypothetical protein IKG82_11375 [Oscillospiraceae bacterium]|nr:hypothetical protein [Oscillospiraceae bacterium]MBR3419281.1 hypothetical protein [Oscillospiraceae bacterium]
MAKNKVGPVAVYMSKELLNGMLCCLDYLIAVDEQHGEWENHAQRIKDKILKYGRKFTSDDCESVVIYFYENEAAILLKAFSLFVFLKDNPQRDYITMMKTQKKTETENG